ncbi:MAG: excisionase family DNA-binding protein [Lachnospiraceae bacterium]|nr:excisionase family DNA-binding protein [Lachnospiraceae bacterium]
MEARKEINVPIENKYLLTIKEAALYTNIGINKIELMLNEPMCPFVIYVGRKRLVKRQKLENYLENKVVI